MSGRRLLRAYRCGCICPLRRCNVHYCVDSQPPERTVYYVGAAPQLVHDTNAGTLSYSARLLLATKSVRFPKAGAAREKFSSIHYVTHASTQKTLTMQLLVIDKLQSVQNVFVAGARTGKLILQCAHTLPKNASGRPVRRELAMRALLRKRLPGALSRVVDCRYSGFTRLRHRRRVYAYCYEFALSSSRLAGMAQLCSFCLCFPTGRYTVGVLWQPGRRFRKQGFTCTACCYYYYGYSYEYSHSYCYYCCTYTYRGKCNGRYNTAVYYDDHIVLTVLSQARNLQRCAQELESAALETRSYLNAEAEDCGCRRVYTVRARKHGHPREHNRAH
ncbi:unnamed protein product [Rangifer tarandus platyrhynchus]|uniref:Uncharacterized protein n=1 Tax=Rangifer tarandus platyrhynchus TaxID=3082113 RepID=A0ABN8XNY9_RANTA|nr:unnamed protein product [Rangifer tarandus platyrhynchus]